VPVFRRQPFLPGLASSFDRLRRRTIAQRSRRIGKVDPACRYLQAGFVAVGIEAAENERVENGGERGRRILCKGILQRERTPGGKIRDKTIGKRLYFLAFVLVLIRT